MSECVGGWVGECVNKCTASVCVWLHLCVHVCVCHYGIISLTHSLPPSLSLPSLSLPSSLPPSLPHSLPPSLHPSIPPSLPPSLPLPPLPPSLPPSPPSLPPSPRMSMSVQDLTADTLSSAPSSSNPAQTTPTSPNASALRQFGVGKSDVWSRLTRAGSTNLLSDNRFI